MWLEIGKYVLLLLFTAGIVWERFRRMRADVNGLGRKFRKMDKNLTIALLELADSEEQRKVIRDLFRE